MRTVRTLVCIVLIAALLAGALPAGALGTPAAPIRRANSCKWSMLFFEDNYNDIDKSREALEKGVTTGTSPSTFSPNRGCTRAQVVTFLYRSK